MTHPTGPRAGGVPVPLSGDETCRLKVPCLAGLEAGVHQSGVSRHLRILHEAGFVSMRPDGQRRLYSLRAEPFRELEGWLEKYRKLWESRLDRLGGGALEERRKRRGAK